MKYYLMEIANRGSYSEAESFEAKNLTSAKRTASRRQFFQGTILVLGREVNSDGYVTNPIAIKEKGEWTDYGNNPAYDDPLYKALSGTPINSMSSEEQEELVAKGLLTKEDFIYAK